MDCVVCGHPTIDENLCLDCALIIAQRSMLGKKYSKQAVLKEKAKRAKKIPCDLWGGEDRLGLK
jgi:hypothetical protein